MAAEITYENYQKYKLAAAHINGLINRVIDVAGPNDNIRDNPNYKELIRIGDRIVPYIFSRIIDSHAYHLHLTLLEDLTGENPVPSDHKSFYQQINDWLSWYLNSKYYEKDTIYHGLLD